MIHIISKKVLLTGLIAAFIGFYKKKVLSQKRIQLELNKKKAFYLIMNEWLHIKCQGRGLDVFFINNGYKKVAIYGMTELGWRLNEELANSSIEITCAIDKNADNIFCEIPIFHPNDELPKTDVIVVTAISAFEEICNFLNTKTDCDIVSLEEVIMSI